MRSNSREDDLLKKLKNCVGDLAESTAYPRHSPSITRPNFIQPKENSIFPSKKQIKPVLPLYSHGADSLYLSKEEDKFQYQGNKNVERQFLSSRKENNESLPYNVQGKSLYKYRPSLTGLSSPTTELLSGNRFRGEISERRCLQQIFQINSTFNKPSTSKQLLNKNAQNQRAPSTYRKESQTAKLISQQRPSFPKKSIEQIPQKFQGFKNECSSLTAKITAQKSIGSGINVKQQGSDTIREECSALEKLRRISELNEKINNRIRHIITVFEENKC